MRPAHRRRRADGADRADRGAATAELALALPVLLSVTVGLVWLLAVASAQVRTVDAAREAARSAARGDTDSVAVAAATRVAPDGGRVLLSRDGDLVRAEVTATVAGPGGLLGFLGAVPVHAVATALVEDDGSGAGP